MIWMALALWAYATGHITTCVVLCVLAVLGDD